MIFCQLIYLQWYHSKDILKQHHETIIQHIHFGRTCSFAFAPSEYTAIRYCGSERDECVGYSKWILIEIFIKNRFLACFRLHSIDNNVHCEWSQYSEIRMLAENGRHSVDCDKIVIALSANHEIWSTFQRYRDPFFCINSLHRAVEMSMPMPMPITALYALSCLTSIVMLVLQTTYRIYICIE